MKVQGKKENLRRRDDARKNHPRDGSLSVSNPARALDTLSGYHGSAGRKTYEMAAWQRRGTNSTHKLKNRKTTRKTRKHIHWDKGVNPQNWRPPGETRVPNYRKMQRKTQSFKIYRGRGNNTTVNSVK